VTDLGHAGVFADFMLERGLSVALRLASHEVFESLPSALRTLQYPLRDAFPAETIDWARDWAAPALSRADEALYRDLLDPFTADEFGALAGILVADKRGERGGLALALRVELTRRFPIESRTMFLSLKSAGLIGVNDLARVEVRTPEVFKVRRFIVPTSIAPDFLLEGIECAGRSQISSPVPCEAFVPDSIYTNVDFDTSPRGSPIALSVRNTSYRERGFEALVSGETAREPPRLADPLGMRRPAYTLQSGGR
jgi:hypothetical protein